MLWKVGVYDDKSDFYFGWYKDLSEIFIQCLPKDLRDMGGRCLDEIELHLAPGVNSFYKFTPAHGLS